MVNGLLTADLPAEALPAQGLVPAGRGSDYARGLRLPRQAATIVERLAACLAGDPAAFHAVDAGEATYRAAASVAGRPTPSSPLAGGMCDGGAATLVVRYFINGAGVGFSPFVAQRTARFPPRLGPYLYTAAGLLTIIDWHDRLVRLGWADGSHEERAVESIEVALGPFEGGGMRVAPGADPTDGLFDVVVIDALSRVEMTAFAWRIRGGDHLRSPRVSVRQATGLTIAVADERGPLYLQADGELVGRDPFAIRILPAALRFVW